MTAGISLSACSIASAFDCLSRNTRWRPLITGEQERFYRQCLEYCRERSGAARWLGRMPDALKMRLSDRLIAYGAFLHFILRKQVIQRQLAASLAQGVRQLVVLGAGFDLLAFSAARAHPGLACFELDVLPMHTHKMHLLRQCYGDIPPGFHARHADFSQTTLGEVLASWDRFDRNAPTLFVAEGLTMYLSEAQVRELFAHIRASSAGASAIFTAVPSFPATGSVWNRARALLLASGNEAPGWALAEEAMPDFMAQCGFRQEWLTPYADIQRAWRSESEIARLQRQQGEYIVYAVAR